MESELNKALEGLTIKESPFSIGAYENPEAWLQMTAVKADPTAIRYINNPVKEAVLEALSRDSHLINDIKYTVDSVYYALEWVESTYSENVTLGLHIKYKRSVLNRMSGDEINRFLDTVLNDFELDPVKLVEDYKAFFTYIYSYLLENRTEKVVRAFESNTVHLAYDLTPGQLLNYLVYDYDHAQQQALLDQHLDIGKANSTYRADTIKHFAKNNRSQHPLVLDQHLDMGNAESTYRAEIVKRLAENNLLKDYDIEPITHLKERYLDSGTPDFESLKAVFDKYHISYYINDVYYDLDNKPTTPTPVVESRVATNKSLWDRFFNN